MSRLRKYGLVCLAVLSISLAAEASAAPVNVPEPLQPWRNWVLEQHKDLACPAAYAALGEHVCSWPGRLALEADARGATFSQDWQLYTPGWVWLPGDSEYWPQNVRVNDKTLPVIARDGKPVIWLAAGEYRLQGALHWDKLPPRLTLPADTGLLSLTLNGKAVANPSVDGAGQLLFGDAPAGNAPPPDVVADALTVQVFRRLIDDIPVQLETVVRLQVAGRDREVLLGQFLPDGMQPLSLESPLPARIEPDGRLRVQLRAGSGEVRLLARAERQSTKEQPTAFSMKRMDDVWPAEEIWSLQDDRSLRQISLSGASSIDPSQTDLPPAWRALPAWLLHPQDKLVLTEQRRGDSGAAAIGDSLNLKRDVWLDFDGQAFTSRDVVTGTLKQAARFSMAPPQVLGRVDVNGEPRLITRRDGEAAGIELRPGALSLSSMSRIERHTALPATAWQQDVAHASATLHLPPGWMLLHAGGVDKVQLSWLARWNLWAIFLVLIVAAGTSRLLGWQAGLVALLTLVLTYHSDKAPIFLWLNALVALTLLRVLPTGKLHKLVSVYLMLGLLLLVLQLLQFSVDQVRKGLYPQLELGAYAAIQGHVPVEVAASAVPAEKEVAEPLQANAEVDEIRTRTAEGALEDKVANAPTAPASYAVRPAKAKREKLPTGYDSNAKVQTGPGEPAWQWQRVQLQWSGPVTQQQSLQLYLLSPFLHRLWNALSVALAGGFVALLLRAANPLLAWRLQSSPVPAAPVLSFVLAAVFLLPPSAARAEIPDKAMLEELEKRLLRLPDCEPQCASLNKGQIAVDDRAVRIDLQIDAQETVAVPLPSGRNQWQPRSVLIDSQTASSLRRDDSGLLWVVVTAGSHRVVMEGAPVADALTLPFAMDVHNLAVTATDWQVSGLVDGGVPGRSLQLTRDKPVVADPVEAEKVQLLPDPAPVFLKVTRTLVLGLDWQVQTVIERVAPQYGAITTAVNLLPGEAVLTPGIEVKDSKVPVVMSADQSAFSWVSSLKQTEQLALKAAEGQPWVERWVLDVAPVWHVDTEGLPPVRQGAQVDAMPVWQPWPGESLQLGISRPSPLEGSTRTIESAQLDYSPGIRAADAVLRLQVRSSQGADLPLQLPAGSNLQKVMIDGKEQGNPASDGTLRLPLHPGVQQIDIRWRQDVAMAARTVLPQPQLDEPVSNISLRLHLPEGRWLLAAGGPMMGPALLFWGVLVVMLLVALVLGRLQLAPVKTWQWVLLGLGMSTVNAVGSLLVVAWFVVLAKRSNLQTAQLTRSRFNAMQVLLVLLTLAMISCLLGTIPMSLLSSPDMQVIGNQSTAQSLNWFQDRTAVGLPTAWALSLPMWMYRGVMLAWSLWLAFALLDWCRWGWNSFSSGELWRGKAEPQLSLDENV
ncbi:MAG TPA: hypothetical protein PLF22_00720 [Pseudomonadales bacterium]|nr:hypothetical protein [Pseudomonadales bacterium]